MRRLRNWDSLLDREIEDARSRPFAWGTHDCALWAANAVREITGEDIAAPYRGRYSTAAGATRALKRYGGGDLVTAATQALGNPVPVARAKRGDMVLVPEGPIEAAALGIIGLSGTVIHLASHDGLLDLPRRVAGLAWGVG